MSCENMQENVSRLMDGELEEPGQERLFEHMRACAPCRLFLASTLRFRKASAADREGLLREADERLPAASEILRAAEASSRPMQRVRVRRPAGRAGLRFERRSMSAPAALAFAAVLLALGLFLGLRLGGASRAVQADGAGITGAGSASGTIIVCGLPGIEVVGSENPDGAN